MLINKAPLSGGHWRRETKKEHSNRKHAMKREGYPATHVIPRAWVWVPDSTTVDPPPSPEDGQDQPPTF